MAIKTGSIDETFTDNQKSMIALYEKQIDNYIVKYYVKGKELKVEPKPFPYSNKQGGISSGLDERVVNEVLRKYRQAGWLAKWYCSQDDRSGTWYFILNKIEESAIFKGKSLKISFTCKGPDSCVTEHNLIIPILGTCKTKVVSEIEEDFVEYMNFCIPTNLYITDVNMIKFVRYYNKDNRWMVCFRNEAFVLNNLKVEII
jgi:hypothetical protein